jgi:hypothetical protein
MSSPMTWFCNKFEQQSRLIHSSSVNLPSSGQQVTARLSARKVSVTGGGEQSSRSPGQGHYINIGVGVSGLASSAISVNSLQQINLHHPASSFLAGHLNDTSLQHLPELLGLRLIKRTEERILSAADGAV